MSDAILEWLGGDIGIGASSKTIALTALGKMPKRPNYPHDPDDFSRCRKLLENVPESRRGLDELGRNGGPVWVGLVARWSDIEAAFVADEKTGWKQHTCYDLMKSIIYPVEAKDPNIVQFAGGATLRFGS